MNRAEQDRPPGTEATASFGYRDVGAGEKQGLVNEVFARVAGRYDLMNDLMSGGLHRLWKRDLINWLAPPIGASPQRLLDVAGGTGDVALRYLESGGPGTRAVVADISREMLDVGAAKAAAKSLAGRIAFIRANAEALAFADRRFDAYTIAFGIRNVTHIEQALEEAYRVLKRGGRFLCLEFSEVGVPVLDRLYDAWSFRVIPELGRLAAGAPEPYEYLVESIRRFPDQERFAQLIRNAGFERVKYRNLSGGIAALHSGWRL